MEYFYNTSMLTKDRMDSSILENMLKRKTFRDIRGIIDKFVWHSRMLKCYDEISQYMYWNDYTSTWMRKHFINASACNYRIINNYSIYISQWIRRIDRKRSLSVRLPIHYQYSSTIGARIY